VAPGGLAYDEGPTANRGGDPARRDECLRFFRSRRRRVLMASVAIAALCLSNGAVRAGDYAALEAPSPNDKTTNEALLKKLQAMEKRINTLESELKRKGKENGAGVAAKSVQANASDPAKVSSTDVPSDAPKKGQPPAAAPTRDKSILGLTESPV